MNKELAKTLTTALVQFIDKERPEGTMCCSNTECERIESSFKLGDFPSIEKFVQKKLSRLTEFQNAVRVMITEALTTHIKDGNGREMSSTVFIDDDTAILLSAGLLKLAKNELLKDDELGKKHLDGYCMGRKDTLLEMKDFVESHFNTNKAREGEDLTDLYRKEYAQFWCIRTGSDCTNPTRDCINCPRKATGCMSTASGTSTLKAEG